MVKKENLSAGERLADDRFAEALLELGAAAKTLILAERRACLEIAEAAKKEAARWGRRDEVRAAEDIIGSIRARGLT